MKTWVGGEVMSFDAWRVGAAVMSAEPLWVGGNTSWVGRDALTCPRTSSTMTVYPTMTSRGISMYPGYEVSEITVHPFSHASRSARATASSYSPSTRTTRAPNDRIASARASVTCAGR